MQDYDIAVAPGAPRQIDAAGNWLYFYAGSAGGADATLRVKGRATGTSVQLQPGQAYQLPPGTEETSWVLTNKAGTGTIIGVVVIGKGQITDNRITGSVEVIDGGKNRTLGGVAFGYAFSVVAGANNPYAQLWNPAGSGRNIIVEQIYVAHSAAGLVTIGLDSAARANVGGGTINSKLGRAGAAASVAQARSDALAGQPGSFTSVAALSLQANSSFPVNLREPIVLTPGWGLSVTSNVALGTVAGTAEIYEEGA